MKRTVLHRALGAAVAAGLANWPITASACSICMGDLNGKNGPAINAAIFLMLGCIGFMLASLAGFAFYLMKRANAPLPPHAELAQTIYPEEDSK